MNMESCRNKRFTLVRMYSVLVLTDIFIKKNINNNIPVSSITSGSIEIIK